MTDIAGKLYYCAKCKCGYVDMKRNPLIKKYKKYPIIPNIKDIYDLNEMPANLRCKCSNYINSKAEQLNECILLEGVVQEHPQAGHDESVLQLVELLKECSK